MFELKDKALAIAGGGLSVVLGGVLAFVVVDKNARIGSLERDIHAPVTGYADRLDAAKASLATCRGNVVTLADALERQGAAIEAAGDASAARLDALDEATGDAASAAKAARDRAERILRTQGGADDCADADALILREIG